jgi:membrane-bound serine protease (ClpP class)
MAAQAQPPAVVYVIPIEGMIDLGIAPFVQRVLTEAADEGAAAVILDINTFGGRLDAAVAIRDALLASSVPTIAFVNRRAISAGALISLASQRIAMTSGGTIGAATPVQVGQPGAPAAPVEEKAVSYVRKEFRATAEARNRPPLIAEAMVDADVAIPGLIDEGKLLTLSTDEALARGIADWRANDLAGLLEHAGLSGAVIRRASVNWAERLVRLLTHPVVSSLLLSVGMLGVLLEIRTPGFGIPGVLGLTSLALFLGGHWIVELAGWEELLLVGAGLVLLAVEVFVLPGFGVAGVAGLGALLAGLSMSLLGAGAAPAFIARAVGRVLVSLLVAVAAGLFLLRLLPRLPAGRRLMLTTELKTSAGYASAPDQDLKWLGQVGQAHSTLRPAGIGEFNGERVDVVSEGELIEPGVDIFVTRVDGNRIVVRRHRTSVRRENT